MQSIDEKIVLSKLNEAFSVELKDARIAYLAEERSVLYSIFLKPDYESFTITGLETSENTLKEYVFQYHGASKDVHVPIVSCLIYGEEFSPSECFEYCFKDEEPFPTWRVSQICKEGLTSFKASKFQLWENMLKNPDCEAAFRRLLQQGPIQNVFERFVFPTPPLLIHKYKFIDETTGKAVDLPHEVSRMRQWNPATSQYEEYDARLVGAPVDSEAVQAYWETLLDTFRRTRGADYINSLLDK